MTDENVESAIDEKLSEALSKIDIMQALKTMTSSGEEPSSEVQQKLNNVLERYNRMSSEERNAFSEQMKQNLAITMKQNLGSKLGVLTQEIQEQLVWRISLFVLVVLLLAGLFAFFGYKLYKSIKEKELKKEQKKKLKQMKKKK